MKLFTKYEEADDNLRAGKAPGLDGGCSTGEEFGRGFKTLKITHESHLPPSSSCHSCVCQEATAGAPVTSILAHLCLVSI